MNWGNKLLFTFIVFASGMSYLVYRSMHVNYELAEKDYYKTELRYQQVIDATNLANKLSTAVKLGQNSEGVLLQLPEEMNSQSVKGDIWFYCSYDEKKDKKMPLQIDANGTQQFSKSFVSPGNYVVKITWNLDGKNYFSEQKLTIR